MIAELRGWCLEQETEGSHSETHEQEDERAHLKQYKSLNSQSLTLVRSFLQQEDFPSSPKTFQTAQVFKCPDYRGHLIQNTTDGHFHKINSSNPQAWKAMEVSSLISFSSVFIFVIEIVSLVKFIPNNFMWGRRGHVSLQKRPNLQKQISPLLIH